MHKALRKCTFENRFFEKGEDYELSESELKNIGNDFQKVDNVEAKPESPKKDPKKEAKKATEEGDDDNDSEDQGGKAKRK